MFNRLRSVSKPPSPVDDGPTFSDPIMDPPLNIPTPVASLDDNQQEKLSRLRKHFDNIMLPETDEYYENEKGFLTDNTLRRYLRARKWDEPVSNPFILCWLNGRANISQNCNNLAHGILKISKL